MQDTTQPTLPTASTTPDRHRLERTLRTLNAIAQTPELPPMDRLRAVLALGCVHFDTPLGAVFHTAPAEVMLIVGLHEGAPLAEGVRLPPTKREGRLTAVVEVKGETYGALVFATLDPRAPRPTLLDVRVLELLAEYVGIVIEGMPETPRGTPVPRTT